MRAPNIYRVAAIVTAIVTLGVMRAQAAPLVLAIDALTGQIDWVDGFSITKTSGVDDNRFGDVVTADASITSPLLLYSGQGSHFGVQFDFSPGGSTIQGIAFSTTLPPGDPASFSGTPAPPAVPTFTTGQISQFTALQGGNYTLAPVGPWDGGIEIRVVPEPTACGLIAFGSVGLLSFARVIRPRSYTILV